MKNAIVVCSGGLDSVTLAHYAKKKLKYRELKILFFDYGQRNLEGEKKCSKLCGEELGSEFLEVGLPFLEKISSSMLNSKKRATKISSDDLKDTRKEGEKWYVPYRNTIFLVYALTLADSIFIKKKKKFDILIGFKCEGKENFPDTSKEFVMLMNKLGEVGSSDKFKIIAPLINMDKEDIILLGKGLGVNFRNTFSCYIGPISHCGTCVACRLRREGFRWANINDNSEYFSDYNKDL